MATTPPPAAATTLRDSRQPTPTSPVAPTPTAAVPVLLTSASESSDDGIRLSPAAARRFARRRCSPLRSPQPSPHISNSRPRH
ncbi:Uncharacterized protein LW93_11446 [Fusarium fujikuroi]|nr:Uncharacterized protein LW93_11446 [Fusarium fujikuroi]